MKHRLSNHIKLDIRPVRSDDKSALEDAFDRLSCRSIYNRFFFDKTHLTKIDLEYFTEPDLVGHVALVAEHETVDGPVLIGSCRYFVNAENYQRAELATTVVDEFQNRGIGRAMVRQLATIARDRGIREFIGSALIENEQVLGMIKALAPPLTINNSNFTFEFFIDTAEIAQKISRER